MKRITTQRISRYPDRRATVVDVLAPDFVKTIQIVTMFRQLKMEDLDGPPLAREFRFRR